MLPDAPVPDGRTVLTGSREHKSENQSGVTDSIYPGFIRDTNAIEALNRQLRKAIKTKGSFPNEDAARKLVYLALRTPSHNGREPGTGPRRCSRSGFTSVTASPTLQTDRH